MHFAAMQLPAGEPDALGCTLLRLDQPASISYAVSTRDRRELERSRSGSGSHDHGLGEDEERAASHKAIGMPMVGSNADNITPPSATVPVDTSSKLVQGSAGDKEQDNVQQPDASICDKGRDDGGTAQAAAAVLNDGGQSDIEAVSKSDMEAAGAEEAGGVINSQDDNKQKQENEKQQDVEERNAAQREAEEGAAAMCPTVVDGVSWFAKASRAVAAVCFFHSQGLFLCITSLHTCSGAGAATSHPGHPCLDLGPCTLVHVKPSTFTHTCD